MWKLHKVIVGDLRTNCYIIELDGTCLIVDPGEDFSKIMDAVGDLEIVGILVTHPHPDHIGALSEFIKIGIPVYDIETIGKQNVGKFQFEVIETPGHHGDCVTFYFPKEGSMFTGDFLFYHTIGSCAFPGGDMEVMKQSIACIKQYPGSIHVYPGHGKETTLEEEFQNNPYF